MIRKTTNGGTTWSYQDSDLDDDDDITLRSVFFIDANTGFAVGDDGTIIKTTDGGNDWDDRTSGTTRTLRSVFFINASTGWVVGSDGTIRKTTNGGTTWVAQDSDLDDDDNITLYDVQFIDANTGWAVGSDGVILKTTDGGNDWDEQNSHTGETLRGIHFVNANVGYAVGDEGVIRRTTNGGATWTTVNTGIDEQFNEVVFINATTGWIVGDNGTILFTVDGGATWTNQTSNSDEDINSAYFVNGSIGWSVGNEGEIQSYQITPLPVSFSSFEVSSTDCNTARLQWETATESNNSHFAVHWSTNGNNWQAVGTVKGHGNSTVTQSYSFNYEGLLRGTNYFRLVQVDYDGRIAYSRTITVNKSCEPARTELQAYPNPTRSSVTVQLNNTTLVGTTARLVNLQGHVLRQFTIRTPKEQLQLTGLPAGTYFVITADKQSVRIIKQ